VLADFGNIMQSGEIIRSGRALKKLYEIIGLVVLVAAAFLTINIIHFQFFVVSVILYACIIDLLLALSLVIPGWVYFRRGRTQLNHMETTLGAIVASLCIVLYAVLGPTVIDRSLSIYILEKLNQRGGEIALAKVGDVFVQEYLPEYRLVDVRLTEQLTSRTAVIEGDCLILTPRGKFMAEFMNAYRRTFLPRKRYLMGTVTDQLTRPFDNAPQRVDVSCNASDTETVS
jgi:hypothetical protein